MVGHRRALEGLALLGLVVGLVPATLEVGRLDERERGVGARPGATRLDARACLGGERLGGFSGGLPPVPLEPHRRRLAGLLASRDRGAIGRVPCGKVETPRKPRRRERIEVLGGHRIVRVVEPVEAITEPVEAPPEVRPYAGSRRRRARVECSRPREVEGHSPTSRNPSVPRGPRARTARAPRRRAARYTGRPRGVLHDGKELHLRGVVLEELLRKRALHPLVDTLAPLQ